MHTQTEPDGTLVVTHVEWAWLAITVCMELVALVAWLSRVAGRWQPAAALAAFGLLFLVGAERSRFTFDGRTRTVRWERHTPFGRTSGSVRFEDITMIAFGSVGTMGAATTAMAKRLTLHTVAGVIPICSTATVFQRPLCETATLIDMVLRKALGPAAPPIVG